MPAPVGRVTIHHRGGGVPSDVSSDYSEGGYTYGIGATRWELFRDVWVSYATLRFNHVSLDICLSGNRMIQPVTDNDISLIRGAVLDARQRGFVVANPIVVPHRNSPGSATVCPGDNTIGRWPEIVAACTTVAPVPVPIIGDEMPSYPSSTKPPTKFRGAIVDLAHRHVTLANAATCDPNPAVLNSNPNPWIASYGDTGWFVVVTSDLDEYRFTLA